MSDLLAIIQNRLWVESHPKCPHCGHEIDFTDGERLMGHVTTWAENEPVAEDCGMCGVTVYVQEHVTRSWTIGRTPDEAADR